MREPEGTWQDSWFGPFKSWYASGKARHIGICDADDAILDEMAQAGQKPHVIQNWMDPLHQDRAIRARCKRDGIQYQAYSTLGTQWEMQGFKRNPVLTNKVLLAIAAKHGVAVPSVVLQWAVRQGVAVLPSSRKEAHQRTNLESMQGFALSEDEMARIDALDGMQHESHGGDDEV